MSDHSPAEGELLAEVIKPDTGWSATEAHELDSLVKSLWARHGWDHLKILIHPDASERTIMFMRHNQNGRIVGRKGVEMVSSRAHDPDRILVVYKTAPTEYVPM